MKTEINAGIRYTLPNVTLLRESGIGVAEIAARTCYDSFENSENECVRNAMAEMDLDAINDIEKSELLDNLAWVHHHHSIIEHATLSFLVRGTSRGVLQEHARHRLQSISVRSTRYTMSSVLNAFAAVHNCGVATNKRLSFRDLVNRLDLFVTAGYAYNAIEIDTIFNKLVLQKEILGDEEFWKMSVAKSSLPLLSENTLGLEYEELFEKLEAGKRKRNVGDAFKHIVTDNWKVDMVITFNIRSLKNYLDLRDSGAAWFQIRWLAEAIKEATPVKYLRLIDKGYKGK